VTGLLVAVASSIVTAGLAFMLTARLRREARVSAEAVRAATQAVAIAQENERFQKRRADEFFGIIEGVEKEADGWRASWRDGMRSASVAQGWLFRELDTALRRGNAFAARLREKGDKVEDMVVDPKLRQLVDEISETAQRPAERKVEAVKLAAEVPKADG